MDTNRLTGEHMLTIGAALATKPGRVHELQLMNNELDSKGGEGIATVLAANAARRIGAAAAPSCVRARKPGVRHVPARTAFLEPQPSVGDENMLNVRTLITARGDAEPYPLTRLTLDTNEVGDVGAAAFARMIGTGSTSLQSAHLVRNNIGDVGASSIADALRDERCAHRGHQPQGQPRDGRWHARARRGAPA